jgi:hypothetical protein
MPAFEYSTAGDYDDEENDDGNDGGGCAASFVGERCGR